MSPLSLRQRMVLAGVVVALLAVVVTAYSVQRVTESAIRGSIERDLDLEVFIRDELAFHGAVQGDWTDVAEVVAELSATTGERIVVATFDDVILADSEELLYDSTAPLPVQATIVDPSSELFEFAVSEDAQLELAEQNEIVERCFEEQGIASELVIDELGLEFIEPRGELSEAELEAVLDCVSERFDGEFFDEIGETFETPPPIEDQLTSTAPPLQLFIGYGGEVDGSLFSAEASSGFWLAVLAVLAVAIAVTVLLAARIAGPIASLTVAARRMTGGDFGARVEVDGGDEIAELGRAFNDMAESVQAEDRARRTLTTDVAHELRSPLANLKGYLEAIQDGVVQPDETTISSLHEEATVLEVLVDDLQQLSLAEAGRRALRPARIDLGDLVERTVAAHSGSAAARGIDLKAVTKPNVMTVVDGDRIRQILTNLIVNSLRHSPAGGLVVVILAVDEKLTVEVRDTGEGIAPEHLPHLFDRFYRADQSRARSTGGSGLGLAIAQELANAHGGRIEVQSVVGEGSTFRLVLPRND